MVPQSPFSFEALPGAAVIYDRTVEHFFSRGKVEYILIILLQRCKIPKKARVGCLFFVVGATLALAPLAEAINCGSWWSWLRKPRSNNISIIGCVVVLGQIVSAAAAVAAGGVQQF